MTRQKLIRKIYWIAGCLAVFTLIYLGSVIFLHPSSVGSPNFGRYINIWAGIWTVNFLIVFALSFILARNLVKLFFEFQDKQPGSRIKAKLMLAHVVISLFPASIMAILALGLINETLDQWFKSPSRQLLTSASQIEQNYYSLHRTLSLRVASEAARDFAAAGSAASREFSASETQQGFQGMIVLGEDGSIQYESGDWATPQSRDEALAELRPGLNRTLEGHPYYTHRKSTQEDVGLGGSTKHDYGFCGVAVSGDQQAVVFTRFILPESSQFFRMGIEEAFLTLDHIRGDESSLRVAYFSILGLSTLAVVLGFAWLGAYIARKITSPIEALAEGSRELADGNLSHRVEVEAVDELGVLVGSFNRMAEEIRESRLELEKANRDLRQSNSQLDERRLYIETLLHNIATGVVSIDEGEVVRSVNEVALKMFQIEREAVQDRSVREFADPYFYQEFQKLKRRAHLYGTYRHELRLKAGERPLHIAATITLSRGASARGLEYLVVLDDLTELIQAEKFAAWQEVATRLAHEIKNPLTPIQLSAERVKRRFERILKARLPDRESLEQFGAILAESTEIIVSEAEMLKALVQEFSRFARLPECNPRPVLVHDLIDRTLTLYDGGLSGVTITKDYDQDLEQIQADPEQLQRAFVNLIDNSLDALADYSGERHLCIRTRVNSSRQSVNLRFSDNGVGIAPEDYGSLFLPYFSRKKKGTGLGLAIVRQIIDEHKGTIRAEPNPPQGTSLVLDLPLQ